MILSILKLQKLKYYAFKKSLDKGNEIQYNLFWTFFGQISSVRYIKEISKIFPKLESFQMAYIVYTHGIILLPVPAMVYYINDLYIKNLGKVCKFLKKIHLIGKFLKLAQS